MRTRGIVGGGLFLAALVVAGAELHAAALDEADLDAKIEALRKGDFTVRLPAVSGPVAYEMVRHDFPFGTCVSARVLLAEGPDADKYRETLRKHFNAAVAENCMKWGNMEPRPGYRGDDVPRKVWQKCHELGIPMRGHCIFWGTNQGPAEWHKTLAPADLEKAMKARAERVLGLFRGKIAEWDLNNEMLHGDVYAKALGLENGAAYFKWCKAIASDVTFYVNDYGILGGDADAYVAHIRAMQADGAEIGGIGVQGHFNGGAPSSKKVWTNLDKLGALGLPIKVTEFDINTKDEARQAAGTRGFYKLCFAHPAVRGILMWGFWEGRHWKPDAALWRKDWSIKPNGREYVRLVTEEWVTRGEGTASADGRLAFRGFYGTYRFTAGGRTFTASFAPGRCEASASPEKP